MSYQSESKLTFGNILLGLLLLGVVVVIGLIVFVYFALTKSNPNKNFSPQPDSPQKAVERLTPDGRPAPSVPQAAPTNMTGTGAPHVHVLTAAEAASQAAAESQDAALRPDKPTTFANTETKPKEKKAAPKPAKPKTTQFENGDTANSNNGDRALQPTNKIAGERELTPTNTNKPRSTPRAENNDSGGRDLTPTNRATTRSRNSDDSGSSRNTAPRRESSGGGERALEPAKKSNSNNIDALF